MTKNERLLLEKAYGLTGKSIDAANGSALNQSGKNAIIDPMSEVLAIIGGLMFKKPKEKS